MTRRQNQNPPKPRLRAAGDAAALGTLIADRVPEVRLVHDQGVAEYVLLTTGELAEIVEDRAAQTAYERTLGEEAVPIAVIDRVLAGESPIRVWREYRGLTVTALANEAGLGKGYLSQLERGVRRGPVATIRRLATVLAVDLDELT